MNQSNNLMQVLWQHSDFSLKDYKENESPLPAIIVITLDKQGNLAEVSATEIHNRCDMPIGTPVYKDLETAITIAEKIVLPLIQTKGNS